MVTQTTFTPAEMADIARRYLPREVLNGFNALRIQSGESMTNPIDQLRRCHEPIAEIVRLTFAAVRQIRKGGLSIPVTNAAAVLIVDEGTAVLHLWNDRIQKLGELAFEKLQEERTAASAVDENIYQTYAARRWPQFETALNAGRTLTELLITLTDRKDCRVLREGYPAWYQAKHGLTGFDDATADMYRQIDQAEERFMGDREKRVIATWREVETGLQRMKIAFGQALDAITRCRSYEPSQTPIPLWKPTADGENVIWVE